MYLDSFLFTHSLSRLLDEKTKETEKKQRNGFVKEDKSRERKRERKGRGENFLRRRRKRITTGGGGRNAVHTPQKPLGVFYRREKEEKEEEEEDKQHDGDSLRLVIP